jgi:putative transposase
MTPLSLTSLTEEERDVVLLDLVHRCDASAPNAVWQADHTELDIWIVSEAGTRRRSICLVRLTE